MNDTNELEQAYQKLEDIEFALDASSIVAITDNKGIIKHANEKFCEISKYSLEELIGSNQNIVSRGTIRNHFLKKCGKQSVWVMYGKVKLKTRQKMAAIIG
ncbi:PAS domain S-box protein [Oceanobacillus damuensis]|uniref:PAS domain S-box protein n=1 Tax=Oceanobacillus damuensis TaxID=937928 RepID=UPI00082CFF23|nr:PAS domain S-box protein [Oceanobacillus damuensis]